MSQNNSITVHTAQLIDSLSLAMNPMPTIRHLVPCSSSISLLLNTDTYLVVLSNSVVSLSHKVNYSTLSALSLVSFTISKRNRLLHWKCCYLWAIWYIAGTLTHMTAKAAVTQKHKREIITYFIL